MPCFQNANANAREELVGGTSREIEAGASARAGESPSDLIDAKIRSVADWRGEMLARIRNQIMQASGMVEDVKWRKPTNPLGVPVWSRQGTICTGEIYRDKVKLTFAKGAAIADPAALFNSSLDGNTRRAIDIHEHDDIDEIAFAELIGAAVRVNTGAN